MHVTPVVPPFGFVLQQSLSARQRSPSTWQPFAGWQMSSPVAYGAHSALQHPPQLVHKTPSGEPVQLLPPRLGGCTHVPTVAPASASIEQMPVQQSLSRAQMSPGWMQNEDARAQVPLVASQRPEQHCELALHVLPAVLHVVLSGVQVEPAPHVPLQQSALAVHAWLSETHWLAPHAPPAHTREQQSVDAAHPPPAGAHFAIDEAQVCVAASQTFEQQSALLAHTSLNLRQLGAASAVEPSPEPVAPSAVAPSPEPMAPSAVAPSPDPLPPSAVDPSPEPLPPSTTVPSLPASVAPLPSTVASCLPPSRDPPSSSFWTLSSEPQPADIARPTNNETDADASKVRRDMGPPFVDCRV